jgi:N-acetylmuramoyl-L-alanine amidase
MTTETTLRIVTDGRIDLPGPLCHVMVGRNGVADVVAAGYAAHAGDGGPFRTVPLNSGNRYMIGVEVENDGTKEPFGEVVLGACDRVFADGSTPTSATRGRGRRTAPTG